MQINRRRLLAAAGAAFAVPPITAAAQSQAAVNWPTRPVHLVVPNMPGGGIDILARHMESVLAKMWPQPIVVDYKPGANTLLGTDYVAKSAPDGHTIGLVVTSHVINPALRKTMPYDTLKDVAGVTMATRYNLLITASAKLPVNTLAELIAYGKANPGKLSFASPGTGSLTHLAAELLKMTAGFDMVHVPYKGSAGAYTDVADGRVDLLFDPMFASMPHVKSGRLKAIAVLRSQRDPSAPGIAAAGETLQGVDVVGTNGIVVAGGTPRAIVRRINADFVAALKTDELRSRLGEMGVEPVGSTAEQYDDYVKTELKRWQQVAKLRNLSIE